MLHVKASACSWLYSFNEAGVFSNCALLLVKFEYSLRDLLRYTGWLDSTNPLLTYAAAGTASLPPAFSLFPRDWCHHVHVPLQLPHARLPGGNRPIRSSSTGRRIQVSWDDGDEGCLTRGRLYREGGEGGVHHCWKSSVGVSCCSQHCSHLANRHLLMLTV